MRNYDNEQKCNIAQNVQRRSRRQIWSVSADVQHNPKLTTTEADSIVAAVLVAVAIPVFTTQLEKSRDATSVANIRSAYAEAMTDYLTGNSAGSTTAVTVTKKAIIQTAQANSWSGEGANLPFTAPEDPGNITTKAEQDVTFTFTTNATTGETTVTCALGTATP